MCVISYGIVKLCQNIRCRSMCLNVMEQVICSPKTTAYTHQPAFLLKANVKRSSSSKEGASASKCPENHNLQQL